MSDFNQPDAFHDDVVRLLDRYREEFDLSYAEAIGVLDMVKHRLLVEALELENETEDEDDRD